MDFKIPIKKKIYRSLLFIHHVFLFYSCKLNFTKFCAYLIKLSLHQPKNFKNKTKNKKIIIILDRFIGGRRDLEIINKKTNHNFEIIFFKRSIAKIIFFFFYDKNKFFFNYLRPKPSKKDFETLTEKDRKKHEKFWTDVIYYLKKYFNKKEINFISFAYYFWIETGIYVGCKNNNIPVKLWNKECFMSDEDVKQRVELNEYKNVFRYFKKISVYNDLMKKMLIAMDNKNTKKISVNGCPRIYDFINKKKIKKKIKNILFLSFNTKQGIPLDERYRNLNWNLTYDKVIEVLNRLSNNRHIKIIIKRKNMYTYKSSKKINQSIKVFEGGTAEKFINEADIIIGQNSGSTIESLANGKHVMVPFFEKNLRLKKYLYRFNKDIIYFSPKKMEKKILILSNKKTSFPIKNKENQKTVNYYLGKSKNVVKNYINFLNS